MAKEKEFWVRCADCGNSSRDHEILFEESVQQLDEPGGPVITEDFHRLVRCKGCKSIKYVKSTLDHMGYDHEESGFKVYPEISDGNDARPPAIGADDASLIPVPVWKMYKETIAAFNGGSKTLAGGGLRATVEAICKDQGLNAGTLQSKIDELAANDLLTAAQAEFLHEERFLGNEALHELETPANQDFLDGLEIVEGLIQTIYLLKAKADRMKARRLAKKQAAAQK